MSGFSERVLHRGFWDKGLFDILNTMVTNFNAVLTKLDADGAVTDTDYSSGLAHTTPSIGTTFGKTVKPNGMTLGHAVLIMKSLRSRLNLLADKLAADGGVSGTTVYTTQKFATTLLIDVSNAKVKQRGANQGAIVDFLDSYLGQWNGILVALDGDAGVTDTNYYSLWGIGDVVAGSSSSSSCRSSSSSCSSRSSSSSSSSSSRSSSSSSSSSCRSSSSSCSSSSCSSRSSSSSSSSCRSSSSSSSSRSSSSSSSSSRSSSSSSSSCSSSSCSSSSSSSSRSSSSSSSSSQAVG